MGDLRVRQKRSAGGSAVYLMLEIDPSNLEGARGQAAAYQSEGKAAEAVAPQAVLKIAPHDRDANLALAALTADRQVSGIDSRGGAFQ
jgi:hypothetical protein